MIVFCTTLKLFGAEPDGLKCRERMGSSVERDTQSQRESGSVRTKNNLLSVWRERTGTYCKILMNKKIGAHQRPQEGDTKNATFYYHVCS